MTIHTEPLIDPARRGMKPREFARRYGLSDNSVYQGCRDGSILSVRVGNRFVILWEKWEKKAIA